MCMLLVTKHTVMLSRVCLKAVQGAKNTPRRCCYCYVFTALFINCCSTFTVVFTVLSIILCSIFTVVLYVTDLKVDLFLVFARKCILMSYIRT